MLNLIALACLLVGTQGIVVDLGGCPETTTQSSFNQFFMRGTWFEIKRYFFVNEGLSTCNMWEWSNNLDRSVTITFSGIAADGDQLSETFVFETDSNDRAVLDFDNGLFQQAKFEVIATDYIDFAIVYSCDEAPMLGARTQSAWLLSRSPSGFSDLDERRIRQALAENGIDDDLFNDVDQSDCGR